MSSLWDFFVYVFLSLGDLFLTVYGADKRSEARQFTIGCFTVILILSALVGLYFVLKS